MRKLLYSRRAMDDVIAIAKYIAEESGYHARGKEYTAKLRRKCQELAQKPFILGKDRSELSSGLRSYAYGNYVIFFHYREDAMEVVTILEGHRDIEAWFDER